jgi:DNA-directed RNA polymerase specialized sigma24 family protein
MPVKYKQVYVLNKEYKLTVLKTATMLNRPVATVEKQLRRALR